MKVRISPGNSKMGAVPSVSLLPGLSCRQDIPCTGECYAWGLAQWRSAIFDSWARNTIYASMDLGGYMREIDDYLTRKKPLYFRWHVGGDILNRGYFAWMVALAASHPRTKFMAFTKRTDMVWEYPIQAASNLTVVASSWPGLRYDIAEDMERFPRAFMWDPKNPDLRIPNPTQELLAEGRKIPQLCPGNCTKCMRCWRLKPGKFVILHKH